MTSRRFEAVLFDLDGTLLDTIEDLADSMNQVLAARGFPPHSIASYKQFVGEGMDVLAERCLPANARDAATVQACFLAMREEYGKRWADKTRPYDQIPELIERLRRNEVRLGVLSNKADDFTQRVVAKFLPACHFEIIAGARTGVPKKPAPDGAIEIARMMGLTPAQFLYVGDTRIDMQTAIGAGMFPVGVLWGFRDRLELEESGARALIEKPLQLMELIG